MSGLDWNSDALPVLQAIHALMVKQHTRPDVAALQAAKAWQVIDQSAAATSSD